MYNPCWTFKVLYSLRICCFVSSRQKVIRNEVRRRWMDHELPTFRRMDTSNNEELDLFVDELLKIGVLSAMGKELIRKKVILIIRERRKYVKSVSFFVFEMTSSYSILYQQFLMKILFKI